METFVQWLKEEKVYLESRQNARVNELLDILYYNKLDVLYTVPWSLEDAWKTVRETSRPEVVDGHQVKVTQLEDKLLKVLEAIHGLEIQIGILPGDRWKEGGREWREAKEKKNAVHYQKALDRLEGLIVARMFELTRMNFSGTGYKMRQHLSQAIKNCSAAIQAALNLYNSAASKLKPPQPHLEWKDVLDYSYLSEFDFLHNTCLDVFKLLRAEEELDHLHVEIKHLFMYMKEEDKYLKSMQDCYCFEDPSLAFQIDVFRQQQGCFNKLHWMRLCSIWKLKGFDPRNSNFFHPGIGIRRQTMDNILGRDFVNGDGSESEDDGEDNTSKGEEEEIEAESVLGTVLGLADDATPSVS
ncbi:hypothetical protein Moror_11771 [Moniliophthora roreri MCA 2997]|nr:hypothetical protein Moror_11771 [Moniliophthora roreri MCA 2997]